MLFLIEYDRRPGLLISIRHFEDSERREAETARLDLELSLSRGSEAREVVLLEAADEDALRRTHRRYFEDLAEIVKSSSG